MASDAVSAVKMQMQVLENKALDSVCISQQGEQLELDWISQLPDELVINILSRLTTLAEAIRTSVLSRRWIHLWKSAVSVLDFDASEELLVLNQLSRRSLQIKLPKKRRWYKNWVNGVVSQLQQSSSRLTKFRVSFNLTNDTNSRRSSTRDLDRWLKFAISKRVESLHLALDVQFSRDSEDYYVFSEECYNHIKTPAGLHDIRFLRSLRLSCVDVRGEVLQHFIANCPVLEELAVKLSLLTSLKVVGSSHSPLPLKHLEIRFCPYLAYVEIDHAPHLERLICDRGGVVKGIKVGNCPSLVDMTLGGNFICSQMFKALSGCASQVVSLFLKSTQLHKAIPDAPELSNLERLTVQALTCSNRSILGLIPLINVCPRLHTLQLFLHTDETAIMDPPSSLDVVEVVRDSIKVVEVVGFRGYKGEYEFVEYVMKHFAGLERIVIDWSTISIFSEDSILPYRRIQSTREAEKRALELKSRAPPAVEFLLI